MFEIFTMLIRNMLLTGAYQNQVFKDPLSAEEETYYIEKLKNNDNHAREVLIEHNLRLVAHIVKKYSENKDEVDDLISIGTIGLIKGINTYKMGKNIKLATYASRCIDNEILMFLRKNKKRKSEISFEDSLSYDAEGNELHLEDVLGTDPDIVTKDLDMEIDKDIVPKKLEDKIEKKLLVRELDKLSERDRKIMILRYGLFGYEEVTQKDVADMLGISQSYISRIEKKILGRMKKDLTNIM